MRRINIYFTANQNKELSNLAERPFIFWSIFYYSVEHAYQTLKSGEFDRIAYYKYTSGNVKIASTRSSLKKDDYNLKLMKELIRESFKQNPDARQLLLATGDFELTHEQDKGIWKTAFPNIMMEVRSEFQRGIQMAPDIFLQPKQPTLF